MRASHRYFFIIVAFASPLRCYAFAWGADITPIDSPWFGDYQKQYQLSTYKLRHLLTHSPSLQNCAVTATMYFPIKALVATTLMVVSVCAQGAFINLPAPGSDITAGANFTVQIGLPVSS
jgi:hypothetical protein